MLSKIIIRCIVILFVLHVSGLANENKESGTKTMAKQQIEISNSFDQKILDDNTLKPLLVRIDKIFHEGSKTNHSLSGVNKLKESLEMCVKANNEHPNNYEIMWRYARGAYKYTESLRCIEHDGWRKQSREWGKKGMKIAERAQKIEPNRVEGYFWQSNCIGRYVDDSGIITALKEGFLPKSKKALAKSYEIDKTYYDFDPVFGKAMLNHTVPWPLKNKKDALKLYIEYSAHTKYTWEYYIKYIHGADYLITLKGKEHKAQAKILLEKVINDPNRREFYYKWAQKLMKEIQ